MALEKQKGRKLLALPDSAPYFLDYFVPAGLSNGFHGAGGYNISLAGGPGFGVDF
jgi:hypothetical protein